MLDKIILSNIKTPVSEIKRYLRYCMQRDKIRNKLNSRGLEDLDLIHWDDEWDPNKSKSSIRVHVEGVIELKFTSRDRCRCCKGYIPKKRSEKFICKKCGRLNLKC